MAIGNATPCLLRAQRWAMALAGGDDISSGSPAPSAQQPCNRKGEAVAKSLRTQWWWRSSRLPLIATVVK
jgi:hypothetical protein